MVSLVSLTECEGSEADDKDGSAYNADINRYGNAIVDYGFATSDIGGDGGGDGGYGDDAGRGEGVNDYDDDSADIFDIKTPKDEIYTVSTPSVRDTRPIISPSKFGPLVY